jgi:hypothetical protein
MIHRERSFPFPSTYCEERKNSHFSCCKDNTQTDDFLALFCTQTEERTFSHCLPSINECFISSERCLSLHTTRYNMSTADQKLQEKKVSFSYYLLPRFFFLMLNLWATQREIGNFQLYNWTRMQISFNICLMITFFAQFFCDIWRECVATQTDRFLLRVVVASIRTSKFIFGDT